MNSPEERKTNNEEKSEQPQSNLCPQNDSNDELILRKPISQDTDRIQRNPRRLVKPEVQSQTNSPMHKLDSNLKSLEFDLISSPSRKK